MTVSREVETEIRRLAHAEAWPTATICAELAVHHDVVARVLDAERAVPKESAPRPTVLDRYKPFILQTLDNHPRLRSTRIFQMLRGRGYKGSARTVRRFVKDVRPRRAAEAYLVCERLPGEQAQIDWGKVGTLEVAGGTRVLWVFLMTMAYSRYRYAELVLELGVESLRRSLLRAVTFFGGTSREWLFDNTKAVIVERFGEAKRIQRDLLDFASALHVKVRLCRPRTPTDKGGVERGIRDLKEAFFAARPIGTIKRGNEELASFIDETVCARKHPRQPSRTVRAVWEEERSMLLPLPANMPSADLMTPVRVDKTASVRLATNIYSVPAAYAGGALTLVADDEVVRLLNGTTEVARHARSWGRNQRIDNLEHRRPLMDQRRAANAAPVRDQMFVEAPELKVLFERWVERGRNVGSMTSRAKKLRELYGVDIFREAVGEMCAHETHDVGALALLCEQSRRRRNAPVPLALPLPRHIIDAVVPSHSLASYDVKDGES